jgi:hypothetical protein
LGMPLKERCRRELYSCHIFFQTFMSRGGLSALTNVKLLFCERAQRRSPIEALSVGHSSGKSRTMNTSHNKPHVSVSSEWSRRHHTHMAVASVIRAIADQSRDAEAIWKHSTDSERGHVAMLLADYLARGAFSRTRGDKYAWGREKIEIPVFAVGARVERNAAGAVDRGHIVAYGGETHTASIGPVTCWLLGIAACLHGRRSLSCASREWIYAYAYEHPTCGLKAC